MSGLRSRAVNDFIELYREDPEPFINAVSAAHYDAQRFLVKDMVKESLVETEEDE
jgi:hypothetical protein